jgi:hypothetical protein
VQRHERADRVLLDFDLWQPSAAAGLIGADHRQHRGAVIAGLGGGVEVHAVIKARRDSTFQLRKPIAGAPINL